MGRRETDRSRWERRVLAYARFFAETALEKDFFARLAEMLESDFPDFVAIASYDERGRLVPESSVAVADAGLWKLYLEHYRLLNPFPRVVDAHNLHDETVIFDHWVDRERLRRGAFLNEFMRKLGGEHALGASISVPGWGRSALSFYRGDGEFTDEDVRKIDDLRPFTRNALMLRSLWTADRKRQTWRDRVEEFHRPLFRPTPSGEMEPLNEAAELASRREPAEVGRLVTLGAAAPGDRLGGSDISVAQRPELGFTRREADVVAGLRRGMSVAEIADSLGVRQNTVRTFLKSIYGMAGVHSSLQLLARLNELDSLYGLTTQSA